MNEKIINLLEKSSFLREHIVKRIAGDRSNKWPKVREIFIKEYPCCAVCSCTKKLQVHHKKPFSRDPKLELDQTNLITLCAEHHLIFGHLNNWKSFNEQVESDCDIWRNKLQNRPAPLSTVSVMEENE